jgi:hypothetical protein
MVRLNTKVVVNDVLLLLTKIEHHSLIELRDMNFYDRVCCCPPRKFVHGWKNFHMFFLFMLLLARLWICG